MIRTFRPSIPEARKAMVGLPAASRASTRGATSSASVDSASPQVRRVRLTMVAEVPERRLQIGDDGPPDHLAHLVGDAGDGVDDLAGPGRRGR